MAKPNQKKSKRAPYVQMLMLSLFAKEPDKIFSLAELSEASGVSQSNIATCLTGLRKKKKVKRVKRGRYISVYHPEFKTIKDYDRKMIQIHPRGLELLTFFKRNLGTKVSMEVLEKMLDRDRKELLPELSRMVEVGLVKKSVAGKYHLARPEIVNSLWVQT